MVDAFETVGNIVMASRLNRIINVISDANDTLGDCITEANNELFSTTNKMHGAFINSLLLVTDAMSNDPKPDKVTELEEKDGRNTR